VWCLSIFRCLKIALVVMVDIESAVIAIVPLFVYGDGFSFQVCLQKKNVVVKVLGARVTCTKVQ
jgi:hypothetical protein